MDSRCFPGASLTPMDDIELLLVQYWDHHHRLEFRWVFHGTAERGGVAKPKPRPAPAPIPSTRGVGAPITIKVPRRWTTVASNQFQYECPGNSSINLITCKCRKHAIFHSIQSIHSKTQTLLVSNCNFHLTLSKTRYQDRLHKNTNT